MSRVTRYLALTAVVLSLAACAASPTEPTTTKSCAQKSSAQPTCPVADFINPNV
jgi:hypothetical protein